MKGGAKSETKSLGVEMVGIVVAGWFEDNEFITVGCISLCVSIFSLSRNIFKSAASLLLYEEQLGIPY